MSSFFQEYGSEMISKVLNIFIFHSLHFIRGRYRCAVGVWLTRLPKVANIVIGLTSALQTVPSLALLALMIPILVSAKHPLLSRYSSIPFYLF